jgi:Protein of unknown function (DUF2384)
MSRITTANNQALLDQATRLLDEVAVIQKKVSDLFRKVKSLEVLLPELHRKSTGQIDAQAVADFMGIPLKRLAEALGLNYKALHRNPSGEAFQDELQPVKRVLELVHEFFPQPESIRVWLNTPHPELKGETALDTVLANNSRAVINILENAIAGVPA